jgi:hypothetical protein
MIDVNKITSTLAKLPDQQLQQYAQMHKSDPYIMALAMSESHRRKEMRSAGQGAQGMQEQPKVVDQMVAEMAPQQLPEDQGIGQLPAGNMNFAGGGIIAFADGGDVERYQFGGALSGEFSGFGGMSPEQAAAAELRVADEARRKQLDELQKKVVFLNSVGAPQAQEAQAQLTALQSSMGPKPSPTDDNFRRQIDPRMKPEVAATAQPLITSAAAPKVDTSRKAPGTGTGAASAAAGPRATTETGPSGIDALQQKYFGQIDQEVGGLRNARAGLVAGIKDLTEQNLAATKADIEKRGDVYKGREARLAEQEKGLAGMGDKYMGLALLQAGAAMMSTPGGLGVALGKGIQVGSERYVAGLDKINAAKEKFAEARDRLDDLRISRDDMNSKEIRAAEKEARESKLKGEELLYNGLVSDLGIKQKNVTAIFGAAADDLKTTRQIAAERENTLIRERGATARNRNTQLELLEAVSKDPRLAAAYQSMHGKGEDVMGQYNDFLKANPAMAMDPQQAVTQFLMTKSVFSQIGKPTVTDKPSTNVRTQP